MPRRSRPPIPPALAQGTATTFLARAEREEIHRALSDKLAKLADVHATLGACDQVTARRLRREYDDYLQLLDDLGWMQRDPRPMFRITMPAESFERVLAQLSDPANAVASVRARLLEQLRDGGGATT